MIEHNMLYVQDLFTIALGEKAIDIVSEMLLKPNKLVVSGEMRERQNRLSCLLLHWTMRRSPSSSSYEFVLTVNNI